MKTTREIINDAIDQYQSDDIEIESDSEDGNEDLVSRGEGGAWVRAWVWVSEEN